MFTNLILLTKAPIIWFQFGGWSEKQDSEQQYHCILTFSKLSKLQVIFRPHQNIKIKGALSPNQQNSPPPSPLKLKFHKIILLTFHHNHQKNQTKMGQWLCIMIHIGYNGSTFLYKNMSKAPKKLTSPSLDLYLDI